ncbi:thioredoxin family protein [Nocardia sp. CDC160]|uniref:thioredoxin family protein n=1 Tax=Nocardia sp. CDC160 TaxID=3112166 RepID=UPI002DBEE4EF|nr:thioredoxin family protein [Nocardia sp. CDC160]MEC3917979.1 thioredoxin family protein [Nocardia sp. CDC160]
MSDNTSVLRVVTAEEFAAALARDDRPVLVDFTSAHCGPCRRLDPALEQFAAAERDRVQVVRVDIYDSRDLAERYGIDTTPTLVLFQRGQPVLEWAGPHTLDPLRGALDRISADSAAPARAQRSLAPRRTIELHGPIPGGHLLIDWDDDAPPARLGADLPVGARASLSIRSGDLSGLARLAPDALDELLLINTPVGPVDVENIRRLTGLTRLRLLGTGLRADGIARLGSLTGLRQLEIREPGDPDGLDQDRVAAIETLRAALPDTRINGLWGRADLRELAMEGGEEIPELRDDSTLG